MCSNDADMLLCKTNHFDTIAHDEQSGTRAMFRSQVFVEISRREVIREPPYSIIIHYYILIYITHICEETKL